MWSFFLLLLWSCMHIAGVGAPETVTGHRGERVDIRCRYEAGYESNSKYFCKGKCIFGNKNIMVKSGSPAKDKRFSLTDDTTARVFTVSITDLRTEDTGQYWCAVKRILTTDVYSDLLLLLLAVLKQKQHLSITGLVPFSTEELHVTTIKAEENAYEKGNPAVISNSHTAQSDDGSSANEFHRTANTEAVDTDLDYMNVAAAVRNSVDPDQIYTELNSSRHSDVYLSLRTDSVQEESIYHSIDQTLD
uniref:Immunoglobulin domain-containing protein n=1 Tax=Sinocyclocheilus grahami TaxID=75366 RepID=A0A672M8Z7_SINGR